MSEIRDLIAILGAIDGQMPSLGENLRAQVAGLVPVYRRPTTVGWFERFTDGRERDFPGIDEAMNGLAGRRADIGDLYISLLARRVLAVALAARAFPQYGPGGAQEDTSREILKAPGILRHSPSLPKRPRRDAAQAPGADTQPAPPAGDEEISREAAFLLTALADPNRLGTIEEWHPFLESVDRFVNPQLRSVPAPCSGTVIEPQPASGGDDIALLRMSVCVKDIGIGHVEGFLDPSCWDECSPWWCEMDRIYPSPPGTHELFYERVAVPCDQPLFEVSAFIDFVQAIDLPDRKVLAYKLFETESIGAITINRMVDVDRGVIEVRQEPDHVHVDTTKRIRFTDQSVDSDVVAVLVCWVGYGDVATDLICNCSTGTPRATACEQAAPVTGALDRLRELARTCKEEAGVEALRLAERVGGDYGVDDAAQDAGRAVTLAVRGWKKVANTLLRAAGDMAGTPAAQLVLPAPARTFSFPAALPERCILGFAPDIRSPFDEAGQPAIGLDRHEAGPGSGEFRLIANDASQLEGTIYLGTVVAQAGGQEKARVPVDLIVP
jgi:hypothetical protein